MKNINPCYLTKKIRSYVSDLICDYGYKSYEQLSYSDKCSFSAFLIDASGKDTEHEFLIESRHLDQSIAAFRKALFGDSVDDKKFLMTLKDNTISYFDETMEAIFDYVNEDKWQNDEWTLSSNHYHGTHL